MNHCGISYNKVKTILLYILLFSIIYQSGTVQASTNPNDILFRVTRILMLIIPLCLCMHKAKYDMKAVRKLTILLLLFELLAIINLVIYSPSALTLQFKILLFFLIYFSLLSDSKMEKKMEGTIYNIILTIATITIIFYFAVDIMKLPIPYSVYHKADGYSFTYKNYFYFYYSYSKALFPRLSGLFTEPGMLQIYMNLALYLFYKNKKRNKVHLSIIVLNILFAQSTSGYMVAAMLLAAIFINWKKTSMSNKTIVRIVLGIIAVTGALIVFTQKRAATNIAGDSYFDRIAQARLGFELFFHNPILGQGFYNTSQYGLLDITGSGNSNGLLTWLYTTGLVGLSIALVPFFVNLSRSKPGSVKWQTIIWIVFVLIENMTEPIYSLSIMVFILACEYYKMLDYHKVKKIQAMDNI